MKLKKLMFLPLLAIALNSCSGDDSSDPVTPPDNTPQFPMTAKINGTLFEMKNPFGSDYATNSIFSDYPDEDYIQLQGRPGFALGMWEIDIWIKRTDLIVGTYEVGPETNYNDTHIDLIDNTNDVNETTRSGHITITEVDTDAKIVKGTFEFETSEWGDASDPVVHNVTDGTFHYRYDTEN